MGQRHNMARSFVSVDVGAVLQQKVTNFQCVCQESPRCLTLSSYTTATNCAPRSKSVIYYCLCLRWMHSDDRVNEWLLILIINNNHNLDFQLSASCGWSWHIVMQKHQGKKSISLRARVKTNERADTTDCSILPANAIGNAGFSFCSLWGWSAFPGKVTRLI